MKHKKVYINRSTTVKQTNQSQKKNTLLIYY